VQQSKICVRCHFYRMLAICAPFCEDSGVVVTITCNNMSSLALPEQDRSTVSITSKRWQVKPTRKGVGDASPQPLTPHEVQGLSQTNLLDSRHSIGQGFSRHVLKYRCAKDRVLPRDWTFTEVRIHFSLYRSARVLRLGGAKHRLQRRLLDDVVAKG